MSIKVGDWVTYDDEDPTDTGFKGEVVEPTERDMQETNAQIMRDDGIGPDFGDVLVAWNSGVRYWEHPSYLVILEES